MLWKTLTNPSMNLLLAVMSECVKLRLSCNNSALYYLPHWSLQTRDQVKKIKMSLRKEYCLQTTKDSIKK